MYGQFERGKHTCRITFRMHMRWLGALCWPRRSASFYVSAIAQLRVPSLLTLRPSTLENVFFHIFCSLYYPDWLGEDSAGGACHNNILSLCGTSATRTSRHTAYPLIYGQLRHHNTTQGAKKRFTEWVCFSHVMQPQKFDGLSWP